MTTDKEKQWVADVENFFFKYAEGLDVAGRSSEAARFESYYQRVWANPQTYAAVNALLSCWCWLNGTGNYEILDKIEDLLVEGVKG